MNYLHRYRLLSNLLTLAQREDKLHVYRFADGSNTLIENCLFSFVLLPCLKMKEFLVVELLKVARLTVVEEDVARLRSQLQENDGVSKVSTLCIAIELLVHGLGNWN